MEATQIEISYNLFQVKMSVLQHNLTFEVPESPTNYLLFHHLSLFALICISPYTLLCIAHVHIVNSAMLLAITPNVQFM